MICPTNPAPPDGFRVWRKPVPQALEQWAIQMRDQWMPHANYGDTVGINYVDPTTGASQYVIARRDHHTWTFHGGRLITGICVPGVTLYESLLTQATGASAPTNDDLSTPDPAAAVYSVDTDAAGNPTLPIDQETAPNTGLVVGSAVALGVVVGLFVAAVTHKIP